MQMNITFTHEYVSPQLVTSQDVADLWPVQCGVQLVRAFAKEAATWESSGFNPRCWLDHDEIAEIVLPGLLKVTADALRSDNRLFNQEKLEITIIDCLEWAYTTGYESVKPDWQNAD